MCICDPIHSITCLRTFTQHSQLFVFIFLHNIACLINCGAFYCCAACVCPGRETGCCKKPKYIGNTIILNGLQKLQPVLHKVFKILCWCVSYDGSISREYVSVSQKIINQLFLHLENFCNLKVFTVHLILNLFQRLGIWDHLPLRAPLKILHTGLAHILPWYLHTLRGYCNTCGTIEHPKSYFTPYYH